MIYGSERITVLPFCAIELFARTGLIVLRIGGQAMHKNLTSVSVGIALTAGAVYHIAILVALAAVLP
jgi:hypothetical protein